MSDEQLSHLRRVLHPDAADGKAGDASNSIQWLASVDWTLNETDRGHWKYEFDDADSSDADSMYSAVEQFFDGAIDDSAESEENFVQPRIEHAGPKAESVFVEPGPDHVGLVGFTGLDLAAGLAQVADDDAATCEQELESAGIERYQRLTISPKLEDTAWLPLIGLGKGWAGIDYTPATQFDVDLDEQIPTYLAAAYAGALDRLFEDYGGLQQQHSRVQEDLEAQVRGKMQVSKYVAQISRGDVTTVPCEYTELRRDNFPNRTLLWALHLAETITRRSDIEGAEAIASQLRAHRRQFADVERQRITPSELDRLGSLPTSFSGYRESGVLDFAEFLIRKLDIGTEAGTQFEASGFAVEMWSVFEDAFAQGIANQLGVQAAKIKQQQWNFEIRTDDGTVTQTEDSEVAERKMRPDVVVPGAMIESQTDEQSLTIIADTKWKGEGLTDPEREDLYQISAYVNYVDDDAVGFLVYPTTETQEPAVASIDMIANSDTETSGDIYAITWPVPETGADKKESIVNDTLKIVWGEMKNRATK